jgi:ribosomal protein S27AE
MRSVGLQPSNTGEPGGMETGQAVSHYIIPDGRYSTAYAKLAASGLKLHWQSIQAVGNAKLTSKRRFSCPQCGQNAWAKPGARLICGECFQSGESDICYMVGELGGFYAGSTL